MSALVLLKEVIFVRARLTFLDFAVGTAFATIPLTPDYEGTASCRAILFPLPLMTFGKGH